MKRIKYLLFLGLIFFLFSCNIDSDLNYLNGIGDKYNAEETLSFNNYFANAIDRPIYSDNTFIYKEKIYKIANNKIKYVSKFTDTSYDNNVTSIEELKAYNLGDTIYVNETRCAYLITNINKGADIEISNELYATPLINNGVVSLRVFGKYDDYSIILNNLFKNINAYNINTLELDGDLICKNYIDFSGISDLIILGHNAKLIVDNSYLDDNYHEFFFNIYAASNIMISKMSFNYQMTRSINGIKTMLGVHKSKHLEFVDCSFDISSSVQNNSEYTNMDLYTNWENVIINNCTFNNLCDSEAGGSLWIRDFHGLGSKDCKVLNSHFFKIAHDEMIAVFMGIISDVLIKNNEFLVPDDGVSSSVMNFTLGTGSNHKNISFIGNNVDACSTGGLIWAKGENVIINDNNLNVHLSKKGTGNFRAIEGSINNIKEFSNNTINIDSLLETYDFQVHILHNIDIVKNNKINVNMKVTDVLLGIDEVEGNEINLSMASEFVFYNIDTNVCNNIVNINNKVNAIFRYYGKDLENTVSIKNNEINYNNEEDINESSTFIMLNDLKMNNYMVNIINNKLYAKGCNKKSRFLFYAPADLNQTSIIKDNEVSGFNELNNYFKNFNIN